MKIMFDYFRKCSSNAHRVCCEDGSTKGVYNRFESDDLDLHPMSQLSLNYFLSCSLIVNSAFKLGMVDFYLHARFYDTDLDTRSQWVGKQSAFNHQETISNIKLAMTVGLFIFYFYMTLILKTCIWLDHLVLGFYLLSHKRLCCKL